MPIHVGPLAFGIAALAAFALFAFWRLRQPWPVGLAEAFGHVAVDISVLSWLLYWSGGATNPFVSLLVMPIALAAAALPLRYVVAVALLATGCYGLLIPLHVELPPLHGDSGRLNLHVAGTAINFVVTAGVLAFFIARLARTLREREAEVRRERERGLRDEGILAIATQAAGTAHELNTPLSTIRTLFGRVAPRTSRQSGAGGRSGAARRPGRPLPRHPAANWSQSDAASSPACRSGSRCRSSWPTARTSSACCGPKSSSHITIDAKADAHTIEVEPSLRHALINLLSNAADASLAASASDVELNVTIDADGVEFGVHDHGSGIATGAGVAFQTSKRDGLGLGLALAHATAERLGGELIATIPSDGGLLQRLRVPLLAVDNPVP